MRTAERVLELFDGDETAIQQQGRVAGSALRVHQALKERPITSLRGVSDRTGLSPPGAASGMRVLEGLGIAREMTGQIRDRRYGYERYIAILNEGAEPL